MKIFTTFCAAALAICGAVYAQTPTDHITVHFNTPVIVGEARVPAGDCEIQVMHGASDSIVLVLRPATGPAIGALASHLYEGNTSEEGGASVVLTRRGNDFHLYRVLIADHVGYQLAGAE